MNKLINTSTDEYCHLLRQNRDRHTMHYVRVDPRGNYWTNGKYIVPSYIIFRVCWLFACIIIYFDNVLYIILYKLLKYISIFVAHFRRENTMGEHVFIFWFGWHELTWVWTLYIPSVTANAKRVWYVTTRKL